MSDDYKIVWSDDGSHLNKKVQAEVDIIPSDIVLLIRLEKKSRGGKVVTVIYDLPKNQKYFKQLTKKLKQLCGTGGTQKDSSIEVQGDNAEKITQYLTELGFKVKRSGA